MINQTLSSTVVFCGKNRKGQKSRPGFENADKLVFLPPKSEKRASAWRKKMEQKGYTFQS